MSKGKAAAPKKKTSVEQRQAMWIEAMLTNGGNATQAAVAAGYKPGDAAKKAGHRLSTNVNLVDILKKRRAQALEAAQENTGLTVAGVLRELHGIVHSDLRKCFDPETGALLPPHKWPDDVAKSMASVKVVEMAGGMKVDVGEGQMQHVPMYTKEVKFWDKNAGIDKAMKHLGMFERDHEQFGKAIARGIRVPGKAA